MSDLWDFEENFLKEGSRDFKKERKRTQKADRSKYKKTDRDKVQKSEDLHQNIKRAKEDFLSGIVTSISSQGYYVNHEGTTYLCSLRGLLKKEKTEDRSIITVGDQVLFEKTHEGEGSIVHREPRRSILSRADNLSRRKQQFIAANIDQVLIVVSVVLPPLKAFLVDRYIIAAEKGGMTPVIVVNKIDLLEMGDPLAKSEKKFFKDFKKAYLTTRVKVIGVSAQTLEGIDELKNIMKDKSSVFSGQSGVGKTSLINLATGLDLRVGKTVDKTKKGAHTTSQTQLVQLPFGGYCIDTPGIKSFGVWNLTKAEIEEYFPDIFEMGHGCKFPNCAHLGEPGCAVVQAVETGKFSPLRYDSYVYLMQSVEEEHLRR